MGDKEIKASHIKRNPVIFRTDPFIFRTNQVIFRTNSLIFRTTLDRNRDRKGKNCIETDRN